MTSEDLKSKAKIAQALMAVLSIFKEISLAVVTLVAQYFQFKAKKAETRANSLETEITIRDQVDAIKKNNQDKTTRERLDTYLDKQ